MSDWDGFSGPHPPVIITTHAATFRYISALRLFTHATAVSGQQVAVMISVIKLYQKHAYSRKIETNIQRLFDTEKERREKVPTFVVGSFAPHGIGFHRTIGLVVKCSIAVFTHYTPVLKSPPKQVWPSVRRATVQISQVIDPRPHSWLNPGYVFDHFRDWLCMSGFKRRYWRVWQGF